MINKISDIILNSLIKRNVVKDDPEVYFYGLQIIVSQTISAFFILLTSLILGNIMFGITYLIVFYNLRELTGGIHCKTTFSCQTSFIFLFICLFYISGHFNESLLFSFYLLTFAILWFLAPTQSTNMLMLSTSKKILIQKQYRKRSIIVLLICLLIDSCIPILKIYFLSIILLSILFLAQLLSNLRINFTRRMQ